MTDQAAPEWACGPYGLSDKQVDVLMKPLARTRVAKRRLQGKDISYLEAWDVKAHLIRVFGFTNFDSETVHEELVGVREYKGNDDKAMVEVIYRARHRLVVKNAMGRTLATYTEGAVGSASGPEYLVADLHDNALKTAASDALKRCAINLGTQFGLSLYDNGNTNDIVRKLVHGGPAEEGPTDEQKAALEKSLGATEVTS